MKTLLILLLFISIASAQQISIPSNWKVAGDDPKPKFQHLDSLKNRTAAPVWRRNLTQHQLASQSQGQYDENDAATITGYVVSVKPGGVESCNMHSKDVSLRDTHILVAADKNHTKAIECIICEVTPRWRAMKQKEGIDWSTATLKKNLTGHTVQFTGFLFYDAEHENASETTHPKGKNNWRASPWEIHPICEIKVAQ